MSLQGFYYDAFYGDLGLNDDHFKQIEAGALKAVAVFIILLLYFCVSFVFSSTVIVVVSCYNDQ